MSLTRIALFIIGLVLAIGGLYIIFATPFDIFHLVIGLVLIVVGVVILSGRVFTV